MAIIISYCTPGNYEGIAKKYLIPSLRKLKLTYLMGHVGIERDEKNWIKNVNRKPEFIRNCLLQFKEDVLWIDADAEVRKYPELFSKIPFEYDIAYHSLDWATWYNVPGSKTKEPLIGTLYLRYRPKVLKFLDRWIVECNQDSLSAQKVLHKALGDIKVFDLPLEYCYINSMPNRREPYVKIDNPMIIHYQASRIFRNNER